MYQVYSLSIRTVCSIQEGSRTNLRRLCVGAHIYIYIIIIISAPCTRAHVNVGRRVVVSRRPISLKRAVFVFRYSLFIEKHAQMYLFKLCYYDYSRERDDANKANTQ